MALLCWIPVEWEERWGCCYFVSPIKELVTLLFFRCDFAVCALVRLLWLSALSSPGCGFHFEISWQILKILLQIELSLYLSFCCPNKILSTLKYHLHWHMYFSHRSTVLCPDFYLDVILLCECAYSDNITAVAWEWDCVHAVFFLRSFLAWHKLDRHAAQQGWKCNHVKIQCHSLKTQ